MASTGEGEQDYGFRIYNPSLGRFLSRDPLSPTYPMLTPYQFASNRPISSIDLDGLEAVPLPEAEGMAEEEIMRERRSVESIEAEDNLMSEEELNFQRSSGNPKFQGAPVPPSSLPGLGVAPEPSLNGMPRSFFGMNPYFDALRQSISNWRQAESVINETLKELAGNQAYATQVRLRFTNAQGKNVYFIADGLSLDAAGNWSVNEIKFSEIQEINASNVDARITMRQAEAFELIYTGRGQFTFGNTTEYLDRENPGMFTQGQAVNITQVNILSYSRGFPSVRDNTTVCGPAPHPMVTPSQPLINAPIFNAPILSQGH